MKPILVTGSNRSGTTWVGNMLCLAEEIFYVWEPFNQEHPLPLLGHPLKEHFRMILPEEYGKVKRQMTVRTLFDIPSSVQGGPTILNKLGKIVRIFQAFFRYASGQAVPLFKDPIALLSSEWIEREYQARVLVMIRHPGAYVNSIKRLDWPTNVELFADQPWLMETLPDSLQEEIRLRTASREKTTGFVLEEAALFWKVLHQIIHQYQREHPDWLMVRHEDLSLNYLEEFKRLYSVLGLRWTDKIAERIELSCSSMNNIVQGDVCHSPRQNSAGVAMLWKTVLSSSEKAAIRRITDPVTSYFYDDASWE